MDPYAYGMSCTRNKVAREQCGSSNGHHTSGAVDILAGDPAQGTGRRGGFVDVDRVTGIPTGQHSEAAPPWLSVLTEKVLVIAMQGIYRLEEP
jgi:hypothetical protein